VPFSPGPERREDVPPALAVALAFRGSGKFGLVELAVFVGVAAGEHLLGVLAIGLGLGGGGTSEEFFLGDGAVAVLVEGFDHGLGTLGGIATLALAFFFAFFSLSEADRQTGHERGGQNEEFFHLY